MIDILLANELWMQIFDCITRPSDLTGALLASKKFYVLTIRALHKRVIWVNPYHVATSLPFYRTNPTFASIPRSLVVAVSPVRISNPDHRERKPRSIIVAADGRSQRLPRRRAASLDPLDPDSVRAYFHRLRQLGRTPDLPPHVAAAALYRGLTDRMRSFTMLEDLTFRNAFLPDDIHHIIHAFPYLKRLEISSCVLPQWSMSKRGLPPDPSQLSITDLTLLDLTGSATLSSSSSAACFAALASARRLENLRIDSSCRVIEFFNPTLHADFTHALSPALRRLDVTLPVSEHSHTEHSLRLAAFLERCPTLLHFELWGLSDGSLPLTLTDDMIPALRSVKGCFTGVEAVLLRGDRRRPIEQVEIVDNMTWHQFHPFSLSLASMHPNLTVLDLNTLDVWTDELLYGITHEFKNLRRLSVVYRFGGPSEQLLISLGSQFLFRLPQLRELVLYSSSAPSVSHLLGPPVPDYVLDTNGVPLAIDWGSDDEYGDADPEDEVRELVVAWRRHCPNLREVQLVKDFIWRRENDGDAWTKRSYEWEDGERNFIL
ncbi:hypothetical protein PLICRDRAFT_122665 [Plicaturopsis crispa FD-325 SS-3]|nr:hypothetical protein PLICRDRAFT_122665 [Plicaturopsis crispa FD-325 SS-3]